MTQLFQNLNIADYMDILTDQRQTAHFPHDECMGWTVEQKASYLKNMTDILSEKGIGVYLTDRYQPKGSDIIRKGWELEIDENGQIFRPVPVGELDTDNNIYLNIKEIGYISSFFTMMHLYGHRVQIEMMEKYPATPEGKYYNDITKYVAWEKPLVMTAVYDDYRQISGRPDADYEADFLEFEREAFAFGYHLMQEAGVPINADLQYAVNTYIVADFEEIKTWWQSSPMKDAGDFNERYSKLYNQYRNNEGDILIDYKPIIAKKSPHNMYGTSQNGVVVVRNDATTLAPLSSF